MSSYMEKMMNKKKNIYIEILCGIILILILGNSYMRNVYDTKKTVTKKMKAYLKEKYKEDFEIYALRPVSGGYTAYIIPSKDINTPKGNDDFYEATVAMRTKPIYFLGQHMFNLHKDLLDTQWRIEVKEKFNNLIGKEIEKLFGKNYLTALEMKLTRDLLKKEKFSHTMSEADIQEILKRNEIEISGGIYIFGRVENEADREYYRKQIYEFIQYLKAENMFDYLEVTLHVVDERFLTKEASTLEIKQKIIDNYKAYTSKKYDLKTYINKRKDIYSEIGENYEIIPERINKFLKNSESSDRKSLFYGSLIFTNIYSEKSIQTNYFLKDKKIKKYDKVEDIFLSGDMLNKKVGFVIEDN